MYISETNDYQLCGHVLVGQHEGEAQGTSRALGKGRECRGFLKEEKEVERELRTEQTVREEHAQCEE